MHAKNISALNSGDTAIHEELKKYFGFGDTLFVFFVSMISAIVIFIGISAWREEIQSEITKENGEKIAAWMMTQGQTIRITDDQSSAVCNMANMKWEDCRKKLISPGGPFASLKNAFDKKFNLFASECSRKNLHTHGAVILEKGTPKPPDGSTLAYSPLTDDTQLNDAIPIRLSVCGRGFIPINIAEFNF